MDFSSLIMGLILLALVVFPAYYLSQASKNKQKALWLAFNKRSTELGLNISTHEIWNKSVLGMDEKLKKLLYIDFTDPLHSEKLIDLNKVSSSRVVNNSRNVKSSSGNFTIIDKLELELIGKAKTDRPNRILVYDSDKNYQLSNELELLAKWSSLINSKV